MARKLRLFCLLAAVLAATGLVMVGNACAGSIGNFNDFFATQTICEEIPEFDFENLWYVVAFAYEAENTNSVVAVPNDVAVDPTTLFSTADLSKWGLYSVIDFDSSNLRFVDETAGNSIDLEPYYCAEDANCILRVCQLTQDYELDYLANPTKLRKGDLIVGFDDNLDALYPDFDNDDLLVALRALNTKANPRFVIEKDSTKEVFDGGEFHFVWTDNITCEADVYYCEPGQIFPSGCGDKLTGESISFIEDEDAEPGEEPQAVFFGTEGGACKPVYIKFGENSKRCAIVGGKKYCR